MQLASGASAANYDLLILFTYLHIIISIIRYPLHVKRDFANNYMLLKIEILLIPLLANSHIFEINEEVHP
jgi:hypothetical protein